MKESATPSASSSGSKGSGSRPPSGLDYSVRFPSSSGRRLAKDPVVLLLGWAGARDRYLAKYTDIYDDEGCVSLRYTLPALLTFHGGPDELEAVGGELGKVLEDLELSGHPLLFHLFSGNGCATFAAMLRAMSRRPSNAAFQASIRGLIFDSAPAKTTLWQKAQAYSEALSPPGAAKATRHAIFWAAYGFLVLRKAYDWLLRDALKLRPQKLHYYDELAQSLVVQRTPALFLYSDADAICGAESIEAFVGRLKSIGGDVEGGRFIGSAHCAHYRAHPVQYTRLVAHFLHKVVKFE